jgi:hypothetical protein
MMTQQTSHQVEDLIPNSSIEGKLQELAKSVSQVYKYELLTTNQYLKQMELVLDIFQEISEQIEN